MRQCCLHLRAQFSEQRLLVRTPAGRLLAFHYRHRIIERIVHAVAFGPPVMIDQEVAGHAGHPGCKSAVRRAVAPERPVHPQEHILRQVLGFCPVAGKPIADVEDAARMATHKLLPGRAVSLEAFWTSWASCSNETQPRILKSFPKAPELPLPITRLRRLP